MLFLAKDTAPSVGTMRIYHGIEQLNDDYIDFERKLFFPSHKETKTRLYWELNEIIDWTDNASKPVTHSIFEIPNPDAPQDEWNTSFTEEMAVKYGTASRKIHGTLNAELVLFTWQKVVYNKLEKKLSFLRNITIL